MAAALAMESVGIVLCVFVGCHVAAQSMEHAEEAKFPWGFSTFYEGVAPFPSEEDFVPVPDDFLFSSWPRQTPEFHLHDDWPSFLDVPRVEVSCNDSTLTVSVRRLFGGLPLTAEEIRLGDDCYRTHELSDQFVFIYNLDECGTSRVTQNGLEMFTNSLHINVNSVWWKAPSTVDISCAKFVNTNTNSVGPRARPEYDTRPRFDMRAVNSLWTGSAESIVYQRGQMINLQVSASTSRPQQQQQRLFVRSCDVSASPEPDTRPRHAVIMNEGCAARSSSSNSAVQFLASHQADVNLALNTSELNYYELYVHCSVFLSDQGVTSGSKSCSYNAGDARWQELSGASDVCDCCREVCKGLPANISDDAKSVVSAGPFVVIDQEMETGSRHAGSETKLAAEASDFMQSDSPESADPEAPREPPSEEDLPHQPQGVVRQEPIWRPGKVDDPKPKERSSVFHDLAERTPSIDQPLQEKSTSAIRADGLNVPSLAVIPPRLRADAAGEASAVKAWLAKLGFLHAGARPDGKAGAAGRGDSSPIEGGPVIRSKLQFTKEADGTQTLSYEEETTAGCAAPGCGGKTHRGLGRRRRLRSTFLRLLRRLDGAE